MRRISHNLANRLWSSASNSHQHHTSQTAATAPPHHHHHHHHHTTKRRRSMQAVLVIFVMGLLALLASQRRPIGSSLQRYADTVLDAASAPTSLPPHSTESPPVTNPPTEPPPLQQLSSTGEELLNEAAHHFLVRSRDDARTSFIEHRRQLAESNLVPSVRACFVSLIRHSESGVRRLHRLLANIRQQMPLMAARYPFVAFHEADANQETIAKLLLTAELDYVQGHESHSGTVWTHAEELARVVVDGTEESSPPPPTHQQQQQQQHQQQGRHATESKVLTSHIIQAVASEDHAAFRWLMQKFVFPKTISHPDPRVRSSSEEWSAARSSSGVGVSAGVELVALPRDDFGNIPSHIRAQSTWSYPASSYWGVSYRHMCRFFAIRIFFTPFFKDNVFDYYMRLDTDSFILGPSLVAPPVSSSSKQQQHPHHHPTNRMQTQLPRNNNNNNNNNNKSNSSTEGVHNFSSSSRRVFVQAPSLVEQDLFDTVHSKGAHYAFAMLHPQTMKQFINGLYEAYDTFQRSDNEDHYRVDAAVVRSGGGIGRSTDRPLHRPLSELPFPRNDMVHYWDNFEIVDLSLFRERLSLDAQRKHATSTMATDTNGDCIHHNSEVNNHGASSTTARGQQGEATTTSSSCFTQWSIHDADSIASVVEGTNDDGAAFGAALLQDTSMGLRKWAFNDSLWSSEGRSSPAEHDRLAAAEAALKAVDWGQVLERAQVKLRRRYETQVVRQHNERLRRMRAWFDLVEHAGGFYNHRWGDAEIRTLTVSLFIEPDKILWVESLPYQHYFNYICPPRRGPGAPPSSSPGSLTVGEGEIPAWVAANEACEAEAQKPQQAGDTSKQRGTARMLPAELSHYNAAFLKTRHNGTRWPSC